MPRPKKFDNPTAQKRAWLNDKTSRVLLDVRDDAPINKTVIQKAAKDSGASVAAFILQAVHKYILDTLGPEWLEENQNKGAGENGS